MTPKDKANELYLRCESVYFDKYTDEYRRMQLKLLRTKRRIKNFALLIINEIIEGDFGDGYDHQFWECVKQELEQF